MTKAWRVAARWIGIGLVLFFFLPFFGVSCAGQEIISISGTDMVWGGKPGGLLAEGMGGEMGGETETKVENVKPQPLAIAAFACALIVASLAWVRKKGAVMGGAIAAAVGFAAMIGLYATFGGDLQDKADQGVMAQQEPKPTSDDPMAAGMEDMARDMGNAIQKDLPKIEAGARMGFWMVSLLFLVCGVFGFFGLKDPGPTPKAPAMGPPMGYMPPGGGYPPQGGGYPPQG